MVGSTIRLKDGVLLGLKDRPVGQQASAGQVKHGLQALAPLLM